MSSSEALQTFLASQTLLLQQLQKNQTEESKTNAECLRSIGEALNKVRVQITNQVSASTSAGPDSRNFSSSAFFTQNVPWPQPLEVDTGDIYDNFELFSSNWKTYCSATGIDKWQADLEPRKVNILLSIVGDKAKKKYSNFHLTEQDKTTAENVLKVIRSKLISERNLLFDRFAFHNCNQGEDESFESYFLRLKRLIEVCKYDERVTANDMLRDRIAFGINDSNLKKKFLREDSDSLTLEKIVQTCKSNELLESRFKNLCLEEKVVNKIQKNKESFRLCRFCDTKHEFKKELCPAWGKLCAFCKGRNHFAKVCLKNNSKQKSSNGHLKERTGSVKKLEERVEHSDAESSVEEGDKEFKIYELKNKTDNRRKGRADLNLKFGSMWKNVICDLDTCSDANVIGYNNYCELSGLKKPNLNKVNSQLRGFGGDKIDVLGEVKITCLRKDKHYVLVFLVVNVDHGPLLSEKDCLTLGLIKYCFKIDAVVNDSVLESGRQKALDILQEHKTVFEGYGEIPGYISLETRQDVKPVIQPARRIPVSLKSDLKIELSKLEKEKIIVKETKNTDWVSNLLLVKKNSNIRICLDPVALNGALKRPHFQFTTLEEILPEIGQAKVFSTVDAKKGFWHLKLSEESSKLTTFWTPFGRYRWLRLPFGISPAPGIFASKMQEITHDLKGIEVLIDDILISGCGENMSEALNDHNTNLKKLLIRLEENNCKLNKEKINLCQTSVKFFGHILSSDGLKPDESKTNAISKMPAPKSKEDLLRFLGMVTYLSRYIKNLSSEAEILRRLTRDDVEWHWSQLEDEEFLRLKSLVSNIQGQKYFDVNKPAILECDASSTGVGAALYQDSGVVGYTSRTLSKTERNYAQIEKELLSIVVGCVRFDQLLAGNKKIIVKTDHKPLISIFQKPLLKAPKRLQLMLMTLQRYNLEVHFVKGKENVVADTLSRAPVDDEQQDRNELRRFDVFEIRDERLLSKHIENLNLDDTLQISSERIEEIRQETNADDTMQRLKDYIYFGWPKYISDVEEGCKIYFKYKDEISTQNGIIFKNGRILVPFKLRKSLTERVHVAHQGIEGTLNLAKETIFWPGMTSQISQVVQGCETCMRHMASQQHPPMQSHEVPNYSFQFVSMDVFFTDYNDKKTKFLVTVDHFSDFFELDILSDLSAETVIKTCKKNFSRHGIPVKVCSDNGTNFENKLLKDLGKQWGFELVTSAPKHQRGNGKAEAAVKIAKRLVKKSCLSGEDLWMMLLHWRNTPNKIGSSPNQRIFSRRTRSTIPMTTSHLQPKIVDGVSQKIEDNKRISKYYYDRKTRILPNLEAGQSVAVQINPDTNKIWEKGTILQKVKDRDYLVNSNDKIYRRNLVHIKPFESRKESLQKENLFDLSQHLLSDRDTIQMNSGQRLTNDVGSSGNNNELNSETLSDEISNTILRKDDGTNTGISCNTTSNTSRPKRHAMKPDRYKDFILYH